MSTAATTFVLMGSPDLAPASHYFPSCKPRACLLSHGLIVAANHRVSRASARASLAAARRRPEYVPNRIDDPNYIRIFDTTLRDGEQSPGATMTSAEKLVVARQLALLGVDVIDAGFPASSPDDFHAVRSIAIEVGNTPVGGEEGHIPVIGGLSRCNKRDIDAAWDAVRHARRPRINTFIATSEIHMQHKLRKTPEQVVAIAREMVAYARSLGCPDVEFCPEDSGRAHASQRSSHGALLWTRAQFSYTYVEISVLSRTYILRDEPGLPYIGTSFLASIYRTCACA